MFNDRTIFFNYWILLQFYTVLTVFFILNFYNKITINKKTNKNIVLVLIWLLASLPVNILFFIKLIMLLKFNLINILVQFFLFLFNTLFILVYFNFLTYTYTECQLEHYNIHNYQIKFLCIFFLILNFFYPYIFLFLL